MIKGAAETIIETIFIGDPNLDFTLETQDCGEGKYNKKTNLELAFFCSMSLCKSKNGRRQS